MTTRGLVLIDALEVHAFHGWHAHEGKFGQHYSVDLELETDIAKAAETDELAYTLDYAAIVATTRRLFVDSRYKLVEAAAMALADGLLKEFPTVQSIRVRVRKLNPPIPERMAAVGVDVKVTRAERVAAGKIP
jgi:dihydroneopterin aldolase